MSSIEYDTAPEPVRVSQQFLVQALRSGHSLEDIANILNVTVGALEELVNAYGLRDLAARTKQLVSIDAKLNNLEEDILDRLSASLKSNVVPQSPMEYARMLAIVNAAKRKTSSEPRPLTSNGAPRLVNIQLPDQLKVEVTVNALGQVTNIDGREISTITADKLANTAAQVPQDLPAILESGITQDVQPGQPGHDPTQPKVIKTESAASRIREKFQALQENRN